MIAARLVLLAVAAPLVLAACGTEPASEPASEPAARPETALTIRTWPKGRGEGDATVRRLECSSGQSDRACARLAELGPDAFAPVPGDAVCTEIYGGPQEARVEGTVDGTPVEASLSRANGCQIARWDAVRVVVPIPPWHPD